MQEEEFERKTVRILDEDSKPTTMDVNGSQIRPPGFHLIQLAFADDVRALGIEKTIPCSIDPNGTKADD